MTYDTVALIVAAGRGERAGGDVPKQFVPLTGIPVVARAIDCLSTFPAFVVIGQGQDELLTAAAGPRAIEAVVVGGSTRRESVRNGLRAIAAGGGARRVLIHDAARPLLPAAVIARLTDALDQFAGAVPALPVADTLVRHDGAMGNVVDRQDLYRVQTPQAFAFETVLAAHENWAGDSEPTDDAQMVRDAGHDVTIVEGDPMLEKITRPEDFVRAERMLGATMISRTAMGFDVHRLEDGEELWLCGVRIPHDRGLSGHSDADVALHALTDALLGTSAAGDIGMHFPPSDPQWRGARSDQFLVHARDLIIQQGGRIDHVDVTLICEAPKVGPHRDAMRARLGDLLQLPLHSVSVKATTTERLGFTGRGEGIAAQAIATVAFWRPEG